VAAAAAAAAAAASFPASLVAAKEEPTRLLMEALESKDSIMAVVMDILTATILVIEALPHLTEGKRKTDLILGQFLTLATRKAGAADTGAAAAAALTPSVQYLARREMAAVTAAAVVSISLVLSLARKRTTTTEAILEAATAAEEAAVAAAKKALTWEIYSIFSTKGEIEEEPPIEDGDTDKDGRKSIKEKIKNKLM